MLVAEQWGNLIIAPMLKKMPNYLSAVCNFGHSHYATVMKLAIMCFIRAHKKINKILFLYYRMVVLLATKSQYNKYDGGAVIMKP